MAFIGPNGEQIAASASEFLSFFAGGRIRADALGYVGQTLTSDQIKSDPAAFFAWEKGWAKKEDHGFREPLQPLARVGSTAGAGD